MTISYQDSVRHVENGIVMAFVCISLTVILATIGIDGIFYIFPLLLFLFDVAATGAGAYNSRKLEITAMRPTCPFCGKAVEKPSTKFCEKCGGRIARIPPDAAIKQETVESPDVTIKRKTIEVLPDRETETCMVCNLSLRTSDLPAWCPHCGNIAHREHLLEWVHVKNKCPKCGAHLNEQEVSTEPPRRHGMPKRKKGVWKTV